MTTTPDLSDRLRIMLRGGRTRRTESVPAASDWNDPTTRFVRTTASRPRMRLAWAFMWLVVVWTTLLLLLVDPTHSFSLVAPPSRRAARQHRRRHDGLPVSDASLRLDSGSIRTRRTTATTTALWAAAASSSLKPAALPLMDSGKALARSGELLIDATSALNIYGGGLSAAGAQIRNAGDCVAQAAASCRFKTGNELVCDELREAAECLKEASDKVQLAIQEAQVDDMLELVALLEAAMPPVRLCSRSLEAAGAAILQGRAVAAVGQSLVTAGESLHVVANLVSQIAPNDASSLTAQESGQRMRVSADKMVQAGNELLPGVSNTSSAGKGWLKGNRK